MLCDPADAGATDACDGDAADAALDVSAGVVVTAKTEGDASAAASVVCA